MTGMETDRAEAERLWRAGRMEDRLDLVERALAVIAGRRSGGEYDEISNDGRKK